MGVVYAAHDERLGRPVAIKRIRTDVGDGQQRERLWREARAAASINHPNVCQLYQVSEDGDGLFLAMELLEGEPLSSRLTQGPLAQNEAAQIALGVLSALGALHQKAFVHRDLKPSNVFLSNHGVKLLDFGLARPFADGTPGQSDLTMPGMLLGTPRYMSPEQIEGGVLDARTDLFVLGIVLYEMVAGRPPFNGGSVFGIAHAIVHDEPPALGGSSGAVALDRIIHRSLRKRAEDRYQTAGDFAQDLREALLVTDPADAARVRPMTRLVVLPFRVLRPDPSIDFLAFSLADAISSALSGLPSLVVRSTSAAARFSSDVPDVAALARALDVDVVLLGTLLSSGEQVRVSAQLVQAPSGTLVRAITSQSTNGEIFQLQDALAKSIVESLSLSLTVRDQGRINRDAPANPEAYECYLRANEIQLDSKQWAAARDLYLRCLEHDPRFAPAWARLGRCFRLIGKYGDPAQRQGQSRARRGCLEARARHQPGPVAGAQSVRARRSRSRARARSDDQAARARPRGRLRTGALRRPGTRLPVLWPARRLRGRLRARAPARSWCRHYRRADVPDEGQLGTCNRDRPWRAAVRQGDGPGPDRTGAGRARHPQGRPVQGTGSAAPQRNQLRDCGNRGTQRGGHAPDSRTRTFRLRRSRGVFPLGRGASAGRRP